MGGIRRTDEGTGARSRLGAAWAGVQSFRPLGNAVNWRAHELHHPSETARTGLVSSLELSSSGGCGRLASPLKLLFSLGMGLELVFTRSWVPSMSMTNWTHIPLRLHLPSGTALIGFPSNLRVFMSRLSWTHVPLSYSEPLAPFENGWWVDWRRLESPVLSERRGTGLVSRPEPSPPWE